MNNIASHLESYLGRIDAGWKDSDGTVWPFYVLRFLGGPILDVVTYSTLGLSDITLPSPVSSKLIRHELVFMVRASLAHRAVPGLLHQVASEAIRSNRPYLRGDVIGPRGILFPGTQMEALYVSPPVYLPDAFAAFESQHGISCAIAWLVPITSDEAKLVSKRGWPFFEEQLCAQDPDLLDINRPGIG